MRKKTSTFYPHLDLHGIKHEDVYKIVENFVLYYQNEMPLEIIYGNSEAMRKLVQHCLQEIGCTVSSGHDNQYGRLLVMGYTD